MADKRVNNGGKREGAGRTPMPEELRKKPKTLRLAPDVWVILAELKEAHGKNQAVIIENLVRRAKNNPELID